MSQATPEPCAYCGQEERYGHNALCVMNTVEELRAEIERLKAALGPGATEAWEHMYDEIERLKAENARLKEIEIKYDQLISGAFI